ncbi:MAG: ParA family protein [Alphaproteobacteria bacterium]|nr:ParA family protein [Alphaproteobacteria bacterium]
MTATVIAIAQHKGGVGKTTLAAHLAVTWVKAGRVVALIDADPQASLGRWHQRREERLGRGDGRLGFVAVTSWRVAAEVTRRARESDIVLIDSSAQADSARALIRAADLALVPVQPSPIDVWATLPTLQIAKQERVPALLVMNRVPPRARLTAAMHDWLADYDVGLATIRIGNRVALAAALADGSGIAECAEGSLAADEIAALASEVLELLPSAA